MNYLFLQLCCRLVVISVAAPVNDENNNKNKNDDNENNDNNDSNDNNNDCFIVKLVTVL